MTLTRRTALTLAGAALTRPAHAAQPRIGVLTTLSGPTADGAGSGSVLAARMAIADAGADVGLLVADMGDRPDVGAAQARAWFDQGVAAVLDVPNSATALAVAELARARNRLALFSGAGSTVLTAGCPTHVIQWTYNTRALAVALARGVVAGGGRRWFFLTVDYAFGHALQADATAIVQAGGGVVLGARVFPPATLDFAALLLDAQASGAEIIGLACTGAPFETLVKQSAEFALQSRVAALLCLTTNIHAIGLNAAQGLLVATPFYHDRDMATRAFTARFAPANRGIPPTMVHAGVYAATRHWLRAAAGRDVMDGAGMAAVMKGLPADDPLFVTSDLRADGSVAHPMGTYRVKRPVESGGDWDYYTPVSVIDDAFGPPSRCG